MGSTLSQECPPRVNQLIETKGREAQCLGYRRVSPLGSSVQIVSEAIGTFLAKGEIFSSGSDFYPIGIHAAAGERFAMNGK
jgi:hypothetical protein